MERLPFKTVHASVRPARVAILADRADQDWRHTCLRIIEFYSQLWGGAYNIIIPTDGVGINEQFWTLLETFDPDYIYRYQKSLEDLSLSHPDRYNEILEREVNTFISGIGSSNREAVRAEVDKRLRNAWISNFEITPKLHQEIKTRLAPFWFEQWVVDAGAVTAGSLPPFHLTNITKIISSTQHPNRIAAIEAPTDLLPSLWFGAVTGRLDSTAREAFDQLDIRSELFTFRDDNIARLVEFTITATTRGPRVFRPDAVLNELAGIVP